MTDPVPPVFVAVDLGASSGRVVAGIVGATHVDLDVVHRFPNGAIERDGHLRWDLTGLYDEVLTGLTLAAERHEGIVSIGVDGWAVDYGLLDADDRLLGEPVAHRDDRTAPVIDTVHARVSAAELYAITGLQHLPFNTIYQLAAERRGRLWDDAAHVVLLPDLIGFWLTGELRTEATNASTTGLVDARTGRWSTELLTRLDLPVERFGPIVEPGTVLGPLRPGVRARTGLGDSVVVTAVGSHDTASAVVGVPAVERPVAYVSCGTWSLVGLELDGPILADAARAANFTNERGVDGRIRFLRNVGGLWLLQESLRAWTEAGTPIDVEHLIAEAANLPDDGRRIDVDDPRFVAPGDMPARIADAVGDPGLGPVALARIVVDSLADAFAVTLRQAAELAGVTVTVLHLVGGGSQNDLLCRRTAEASGLPVAAGPVEATALGNVLVQARAHGAVPATSLDDLRAWAPRSAPTRRYEPTVAGAPR